MASTTAEQFELIKDDPRRPATKGPKAILHELRSAKEKHGELLTLPLAVRLLGVSRGQLGAWMTRGRLSRVEIGSCVFVPASEVEALYDERTQGELSKGGRGTKLPSMAEVVKLQQKGKP